MNEEEENFEIDDDEDDVDEGLLKIQALARRFLERCRILKQINARYEKIYDPIKKRYYYYDTTTDSSSWFKPVLLLNNDILIIAPTYTKDEAAIKLQCLFRLKNAIKRVRKLYESVVVGSIDNSSGLTYYYNTMNGSSSWELPLFMGGKLHHQFEKLKKSQSKKKGFDTDIDESDSDASLDSKEIREKKRLARKYPRYDQFNYLIVLFIYFFLYIYALFFLNSSKVQQIVDVGVDNIDDTKELNLSHIGSTRFSSRIYDCSYLQILNISHNKLKRISTDIHYFIKFLLLLFYYSIL
jgi:Leucine-rich repeat (LRR) protein